MAARLIFSKGELWSCYTPWKSPWDPHCLQNWHQILKLNFQVVQKIGCCGGELGNRYPTFLYIFLQSNQNISFCFPNLSYIVPFACHSPLVYPCEILLRSSSTVPAFTKSSPSSVTLHSVSLYGPKHMTCASLIAPNILHWSDFR